MKYNNYYSVKNGNSRHIVKMEIEGKICKASVISYDKNNGKLLPDQSGDVFYGEVGRFDLAKGIKTINNLYVITDNYTQQCHSGFIKEKYMSWRDEFASNFCGIDVVESVEDFTKVVKNLGKNLTVAKPQPIQLL